MPEPSDGCGLFANTRESSREIAEPSRILAPDQGSGIRDQGEEQGRDQGARASRLPADWTLPPEWCDWAMQERGWTADRALSVSAVFRDHWISKPGKDGRKLDWEATWRNWCRNERGNGVSHPLNRQEQLEARNAAAAAQFLARSGANG